jgi:hypothetical protein
MVDFVLNSSLNNYFYKESADFSNRSLTFDTLYDKVYKVVLPKHGRIYFLKEG